MGFFGKKREEEEEENERLLRGEPNDGQEANASSEQSLSKYSSILTDEEEPIADKFVDSPEQEDVDPKDNGFKLLISFLAILFVGLGNKVFSKLEMKPMNNYSYFVSLYSTFVYIPCSFAYIIPMILFGKQITKEQRAIPQWDFCVMGALDSVAGIMQVFATTFLDGALGVLLSQSAIPISMILSYYLMDTRYNLFHVLGAVVVISGLAIVLGPQLAQGTFSVKDLQWVACMMGACIPMTLSSIYKEKALGNADVDPVYLNGWIAVWQFLFSLPLAIPSSYVAGGSQSDPTLIGVKAIPKMVWFGLKCYVGVNSITEGEFQDDCESAPLFVNIYLFFNLGYNVLIIIILKYGSANLLWLAMALMVPLASLTFALPIVPDPKPMQPSGYAGLAVVMVGLIFFRFSTVFVHMMNRCLGRLPEEEAEASEPLLETVFARPRTTSLLHFRAEQMDLVQYMYAPKVQERVLRRPPVTIRSGYLGRLGIRVEDSPIASRSHAPLTPPWESPQRSNNGSRYYSDA